MDKLIKNIRYQTDLLPHRCNFLYNGNMNVGEKLESVTMQFRDRVNKLAFSLPVTHIYNPLSYAWDTHRQYLTRYGNSYKKVIFLGMNPGPWGMAQTGIPFGEISIAKDWLKIEGQVKQPEILHPKRPVTGFQCHRSEVSGRRLWGLFRNRFKTPEAFFADYFVMNYCPLLFFDTSGKNITPDKLPIGNRQPLLEACDAYLGEIASILQPDWCIGIGRFAEQQAASALENSGIKVTRILHPSPANPHANRDFSGQAIQTLTRKNIW